MGQTKQDRGEGREGFPGPLHDRNHAAYLAMTTTSLLPAPSPQHSLALTAWGLGAPCSLIRWLCKSFFCMNCWEQEEHWKIAPRSPLRPLTPMGP